MSKLAWYSLPGTYWRWYRLRTFLLNVNIRIMTLYCRHLGYSGDTVLIPNLQFKTKSGRNTGKLFTKVISLEILSKESSIRNTE